MKYCLTRHHSITIKELLGQSQPTYRAVWAGCDTGEGVEIRFNGPCFKRSSYQAVAQVLTDLATIHVLIPENCYQ